MSRLTTGFKAPSKDSGLGSKWRVGMGDGFASHTRQAVSLLASSTSHRSLHINAGMDFLAYLRRLRAPGPHTSSPWQRQLVAVWVGKQLGEGRDPQPLTYLPSILPDRGTVYCLSGSARTTRWSGKTPIVTSEHAYWYHLRQEHFGISLILTSTAIGTYIIISLLACSSGRNALPSIWQTSYRY